VEDWRRNVWVGGSSPFFVDDNLLAAWEFEFGLFQVYCACVVVVTLQRTNNRTWPITT